MTGADEVHLGAVGPSDRVWLALVLGFFLLNAADLGATARLVGLGAVELNPVMATAIEAGWAWAIALKGIVTIGVACGLWFGRRHRLVRRAGVGFVLLLGGLATYQMIDLTLAN